MGHAMPELLLELFSEEIPARMQARAADDLKRLVCERLKEAGLDYERAEAFVTPRRAPRLWRKSSAASPPRQFRHGIIRPRFTSRASRCPVMSRR